MKSQLRYAIICAPVLTALLLAQAYAQANARIGILKGKVKEENGKALEGVTVRATKENGENGEKGKEEKRETKSNEKGDFEFPDLPAGRYTLSLEKQGYKIFTTRKLEITTGEITRLSRAVELKREGEPYAVIR